MNANNNMIALADATRRNMLDFSRNILSTRGTPLTIRRDIFRNIHGQFNTLRDRLDFDIDGTAAAALKGYNYAESLDTFCRFYGWQG